MSQGIRVASAEDIAEGEGITIGRDVAGTADDIALLKDDDGSIWALDNTCTHQTASLAEGWVEGGYVECPLHSSRFCLRNGEVDGLPATRDTVAHRVEVRDGEVYLFPGQTP
ncbi:non-heme iron oxygenase ferredoxin subunit [Klenkia sp. LSe6-5]|uniref:Non-heme iron oxygenase ferredoxin subunit n=1 Tax=Klenkia sesuvii TaxID=3103137 RepID=A0ABU8DQP3_9ACTN